MAEILYPTPCPACSGVAAWPAGVTTAGQSTVVVHMRCKDCAHTWSVTRTETSTPPIETAKPYQKASA